MVTTAQEASLLSAANGLTLLLSDVVESMAETKLRQSLYPELSRVRCRFREGTLALWGRVSTYFLKQIAQALLVGVDGVVSVDNQLEVASPPARRRPDNLRPRPLPVRRRQPR